MTKTRLALNLTVACGMVRLIVQHGTPALGESGWPRFEKQILTDQYYCDGVTAGDINRDGKADIVAGPFWNEGPGFTNKHEVYAAKAFPTEPSPTDSMFSCP
jgi:hypothetical protein